MNDDLVERVAMGLYQHKFSDIASDQIARMWGMMTEAARDRYRGYARVAIALIEPAVRAECAKVADAPPEDFRMNQMSIWPFMRLEMQRRAAVIRAGCLTAFSDRQAR